MATRPPTAPAIIVFVAAAARRPSEALERAAGIECEPAEEQDDCADDCHQDIMAGKARASVFLGISLILECDDDSARQSQHAAHGMNDCGTCKVHNAVAKYRSFYRAVKASRRPRPSLQRADKHGNEERRDNDCGMPTRSAIAPVGITDGCIHEHHLEEKRVGADIVNAGQEKSLFR